jgi:hypothetical protein
MSSPSLIFVMVEDKRQQQLIYRFLVRVGVRLHQLRFQLSPSGRGSAEQWVRESFARQAASCRARNARASSGMLVLIDADNRTVQDRLDELDRGLASVGQRPIDPSRDPIARLVPKRNVETWILYLSAQATSSSEVNETKDYKLTMSTEEWSALIPRASEVMFALTRPSKVLPVNLIDSLRRGIEEIPRALPPRR